MFPRILVRWMGVLLLGLAPVAYGQSRLTLEVHTGHGAVGYDVNSVLIAGERDMLLIDAQLALSEAHKLVAKILESKKNLATIYVTHPHPDHMFGLAVLRQSFPQARILALPQTVAAARTSWPARQKFWLPTYGNNIPGPEPVLPEELTTGYLELEGHRFPITGPVGGSDGPGNSFVHIPPLKAVVAGDIVYDQVYFGVQKDKNREEWLKTIDQIVALKPEMIIPGHEGPRATRNLATIAFMRKYVSDWDANVSRSKNAQEMKKNTLRKYPKLGMAFALDSRVAAYFPAQQP